MQTLNQPQPQPRTPLEISELKRQWVEEGGWKIEDTEGFEAHRAELLAYSTEYIEKCAAEQAAKIARHEAAVAKKAKVLGCDNPLLVEHIMLLEDRIASLITSQFVLLSTVRELTSREEDMQGATEQLYELRSTL